MTEEHGRCAHLSPCFLFLGDAIRLRLCERPPGEPLPPLSGSTLVAIMLCITHFCGVVYHQGKPGNFRKFISSGKFRGKMEFSLQLLWIEEIGTYCGYGEASGMPEGSKIFNWTCSVCKLWCLAGFASRRLEYWRTHDSLKSRSASHLIYNLLLVFEASSTKNNLLRRRGRQRQCWLPTVNLPCLRNKCFFGLLASRMEHQLSKQAILLKCILLVIMLEIMGWDGNHLVSYKPYFLPLHLNV